MPIREPKSERSLFERVALSVAVYWGLMIPLYAAFKWLVGPGYESVDDIFTLGALLGPVAIAYLETRREIPDAAGPLLPSRARRRNPGRPT